MMHISSTRLLALPLVTLVLLFSSPSSAQVFKCTANGQATYQQSPCSGSHRSEQIEQKRTIEQEMIDRQNQTEALIRHQERQQRESIDSYQNNVYRAPAIEPARQQQAAPRVDQQLCASKTRSLRIAGSKTYHTANERVAAITAAEIAANQACGTSTAGGASRSESAKQQSLSSGATERRNRFKDNPAPTVMTHCNGSYCYDNLGGTYFSQGNGYYVGPSGNMCNAFGGEMQCH